MTTQVDNGELYLARYCGPRNQERVEIRPQTITLSWVHPLNDEVLDIPWDNFKEIVRLGQQLIEKANAEEEQEAAPVDHRGAREDDTWPYVDTPQENRP